MADKPKIYIASPMVFRESSDVRYEELLKWLEELGWEVLDPRFLTEQGLIDDAKKKGRGPQARTAWKKVNPVIYRNNAAGIDRCDVILMLAPVGVALDEGACFELGRASAKAEKRLEILRDDWRELGDNPGCCINLMLEEAALDSGGKVSRHISNLKKRLKGLYRTLSAS